jgi:hypothetical protein
LILKVDLRAPICDIDHEGTARQSRPPGRWPPVIFRQGTRGGKQARERRARPALPRRRLPVVLRHVFLSGNGPPAGNGFSEGPARTPGFGPEGRAGRPEADGGPGTGRGRPFPRPAAKAAQVPGPRPEGIGALRSRPGLTARRLQGNSGRQKGASGGAKAPTAAGEAAGSFPRRGPSQALVREQ